MSFLESCPKIKRLPVTEISALMSSAPKTVRPLALAFSERCTLIGMSEISLVAVSEALVERIIQQMNDRITEKSITTLLL